MKKLKIFLLLSLYIFSCIPFKESLDDPFTKEGFLKHYFFYLKTFQAEKGKGELEVMGELEAKGEIDLEFGINGIVKTDITGNDDLAYSVFLQPDGKILLGGHSKNGTNYDFALVRYNSNGSLDTEFGSSGIVTTNINPDNDYAYSVFLQPDGKILLGGQAYNGTNFDFALVRYEYNGILDNSFGNNGKVITNISNGDDFATTIIVQPNGKILVAGYSYNGANYGYALIRYHTDGSIDTSFGNNGIVIIPIGIDQSNEAHSIALQPDGKVLLAGYYDADPSANINYDFVLVRIK